MTAAVKIPETSLWANRKCLLICAIVAIANMQYGLDSAAIGSLQAMPGFLAVFGYEDPAQPGGYAIEGTFQQLIGSLLTLGAFLSSLVAGAFAHFFGRKVALWLACVLNAVACIIQISATDKVAVYIGRLILGLANGFLVTFSNIYGTAEAAPAHLRAVMVALFSEWVNIGSIIGAAATYATKNRLDKASYQIPVGILFVVPTFLAAGLLFVPESPRYLLYRGKNEAAKEAFKKLRGNSLPADGLELEWVEMVKGIEEEKQLAKKIGPLDMFKGTELRRTLLCYGVIATQTGAGSWFVISYSTYFMIVAGLSVDDAFKFSVMNSCLGLVGVNIGMYLMRYVMGRRTVLMTGAIAQGCAMLGMAVSATAAYGTLAARDCLIAFSALYMFLYNAFVGDATYPTATEMVSTRLRSWSVGSAISLGYFLAWLTGFCSPYFINPENLNWGAKYGYIWAASNFCCFVFFYLCVPETKGRTLEEIDELFINRVSVHKFKSFKTTIIDEALKDVESCGIGEGKNGIAATEHVDVA
ncbi:general substrate transporter [Xylariaceae sp. FL0662B]|nr:general substrate transporter [Xylariaceae sp. FL0662B]